MMVATIADLMEVEPMVEPEMVDQDMADLVVMEALVDMEVLVMVVLLEDPPLAKPPVDSEELALIDNTLPPRNRVSTPTADTTTECRTADSGFVNLCAI